MSTTINTSPALLLFAAFGAIALGSDEEPAAMPTASIEVAMGDCDAERRGKITGGTGVMRLLFSGPPKDKLVKRGTVDVDGNKYNLYLPKAKTYSTVNAKKDDSDFENTSTLISIDHNGDGVLSDDEGWFANLPLRFGDKMFDVSGIAADGSRITLKPSKSRLRGVIVGRSCPPFSFRTADGKEITRESLSGKALVLDIWSIT